MSWTAVAAETDRYLEWDRRISCGSLSGTEPPEPLPNLRDGVELYDVTKAWIEAVWGSDEMMPRALRNAWYLVLTVSREQRGDKAAILNEWANRLCLAEPSVPPPADSTVTPPSVSNPGKLILAVLLRHYPVLQTIENICDGLREIEHYSERTVGPELNKLIDGGLAERPDGKRRGARLTATGKALAEQLSTSA